MKTLIIITTFLIGLNSYGQISFGEDSNETNTIVLRRGDGGMIRSNLEPDEEDRYTFYWRVINQDLNLTVGSGFTAVSSGDTQYNTITFKATWDEIEAVREFLINNFKKKSSRPVNIGDTELIFRESSLGANIYDAYNPDGRFEVILRKNWTNDLMNHREFQKKISDHLERMRKKAEREAKREAKRS